MTFLSEYFGFLVFAFVILICGLLLFPGIGVETDTTFGEVGRLGLALLAIAGGFTWWYLPAIREADNP